MTIILIEYPQRLPRACGGRIEPVYGRVIGAQR
jgi:hypothetical protein